MKVSARWVVTGIASVAIIAAGLFVGERTEAHEHLANFLFAPSEEDIQKAEGDVFVPDRDQPPQASDVPVRYGPYLLVPRGWVGPLEDAAVIPDPPPFPSDATSTRSLSEVRGSVVWSEPDLPVGFEVLSAGSEHVEYNAFITFGNERGDVAQVSAWRVPVRPIHVNVWGGDEEESRFEQIELLALPGLLLVNPAVNGSEEYQIRAFDDSSGIEYAILSNGLTRSEVIRAIEGMIR